LRLVGLEPATHPTATAAEPVGQPLVGATDPRWVLALRTAESLQGATLSPERRQNLLRLGRIMGLSPFDSNLVIAIVQDQARRGFASDYCPTAAAPQLSMVPLPRAFQSRTGWRALMPLPPRHMAVLAVIVATEILLVLWMLS
jgi:hypothetical protein